MKQVKGFLMLFLLVASLFLLVVVPIETYRTVKAQSWKPVEVEIITSGIKRVWSDFALEIRVRDLKTGAMSNRVAVQYGDIDFSLIAVASLISSTKYADRDKYVQGQRLEAFRNPEGTSYVLEQNSITQMVVVFLLACIYPAIAVAALVRRSTAS